MSFDFVPNAMKVSGLAILLVAVVGTIALKVIRRPEVTPSIRGMEVARKLGCFACHGPEGVGGVGTIGDAGKTMPGWDHGTTAMYVSSEQDIREWILYGAPLPEDASGEVYSYDGLVPMPAYDGLLSDRELDDLVSYYRAVSGWAPDIADDAYEGWKIASQLGCFGCHGPAGMGGVPNPGSFTGQIPPWDGEGYAELVKNDDELRAWILDGRIERLWANPIARYFLEGQVTQMPAYRDHVSTDQVCKMVAYIGWLRQE